MKLATLILLAASTTAHADEATVQRELLDAIQKRDVAAVKARVKLPLEAKHLRFVDKKCADFTSSYAAVEEHELATFVGCLADATVVPREGYATYGAGAPLYLSMWDGKLASLESIESVDEHFMLDPDAFASHIKAFKREVVPAAALKRTIDASADGRASASVVVCVDKRGKITDLDIQNDSDASYEADVKKAARLWKVQPFRFGKTAVPACAALLVGYPAARIDPPLGPIAASPPPPPPPPPPPSVAQSVPPTLLESYRIAGEKAIVPDDATKVAIRDAGASRVIGSFKLCLDDTGAIAKIVTLKTTGFEPYDRTLIRGMRQWRYRPYQVNGKAVPVCTAVTFIYNQQPAP